MARAASDRLAPFPRSARMPMPKNVPIIDTMLGVPSGEQKRSYDFMRPLLRDEESLRSFEFPVQYMFKDFPKVSKQEDYIRYTLALMDKYGIEKAHDRRVARRPDANSNVRREGAPRSLHRLVRRRPEPWHGGRARHRAPARGVRHQVRRRRSRAATSRRSRSTTSASTRSTRSASSSTSPIFCCVGVPGPRIPMEPQHVEQRRRGLLVLPGAASS